MDKFDDILYECRQITLDQKNSEDINYLTSCLILMGALEIIAILSLYVKDGYTNLIFTFLGVLFIMFLIHKIFMSKARKHVATYESSKVLEEGGQDLQQKLSYLNAGLELKLTRLRSVKWFYVIVFPIFLLTIQQIFIGVINTKFSIWILPILFPTSYFVWQYFFNNDKTKLEIVKNRVSYLRSQV